MNQEKISNFISTKRKEKNLTQEQLSEKLGISTNAVSKWERGICLMNMSLLKPLSKILDVSINEILSGEKIEEKDIRNKADENIINLAELYDLKSTKSGVFAFSIMALFLLIYCSNRDINTIPIILLWWIYNFGYSYNKFKLTKDKKEIIIASLNGIGMIITAIIFFIKTF